MTEEGAKGREGTPIVVEVVSVSRLTPGLVRIVFGGDDLSRFDTRGFTDEYVKLQFAAPGASYDVPFDVPGIRAREARELWPRTRTYTVQNWDPDQHRITIDFVYHGSRGVAGPWASRARRGDRLQLVGPGGAYAPDPRADWHLLVGDASVLPAISASLARIPARVPVFVLVEVDNSAEEIALETDGDLHLTWLYENGEPDPARLSDALAELDFPPGSVHAFVHGEAASVRALRRHLLVDRGIPRDALSVSGYWKRASDEDEWRSEKPRWNREVEQDTT